MLTGSTFPGNLRDHLAEVECMDRFLPALVQPNRYGRAYQPSLPRHELVVSDRGLCPTSSEFAEQMMGKNAPSK